jgi:hypothetical protein
MLEPYRSRFNTQFTASKYETLIADVHKATGGPVAFRICETPCFFSSAFMQSLADLGRDLTQGLLANGTYRKASGAAIPEQYRVRNESAMPHFMTVDFGLVRAADGTLQPRLVELQAFPSIYGFQDVLARQYIETYGLSGDLTWLLGGHDEASYWALLRQVIVGDHDPQHVVLLDIEPEQQMTLPDFRMYEKRFGIAIVDIAKVRQNGKDLFYESQGRWIPIRRIFNRAIVDELERKQVVPGFSYQDDLNVEWAGHPNWYFRLSKFSLPYLDHPAVPPSVFLDRWFEDGGVGRLPEERDRLLLKPLFSFAGKGIQFAPSDEDLQSIPVEDRPLYLMQERVNFEPVIETPHGLTQAEIRILYVWPDAGELQPVSSLVRLGRGLMMGVDHNRDQQWVGGSAALFPRQL